MHRPHARSILTVLYEINSYIRSEWFDHTHMSHPKLHPCYVLLIMQSSMCFYYLKNHSQICVLRINSHLQTYGVYSIGKYSNM